MNQKYTVTPISVFTSSKVGKFLTSFLPQLGGVGSDEFITLAFSLVFQAGNVSVRPSQSSQR